MVFVYFSIVFLNYRKNHFIYTVIIIYFNYIFGIFTFLEIKRLKLLMIEFSVDLCPVAF